MTPEKSELSPELLREALNQIDQGKMNTEISRFLGLSTSVLARIRKEHDRPASPGRWKSDYSKDKKRHMIELLEEGHTVQEVSKITGVKPSTLRRWREKELEMGNNIPTFEPAQRFIPPPKYRYSDEEIIELVLLNPGYGMNRLINVLYPGNRDRNSVRFRITELLDAYEKSFFEDLYGYLQNPDLSTMVTEEEWLQITGEKNLPAGYGRGRAKRKNSKSRNKMYVPLPPQEFNWGPISKK